MVRQWMDNKGCQTWSSFAEGSSLAGFHHEPSLYTIFTTKINRGSEARGGLFKGSIYLNGGVMVS